MRPVRLTVGHALALLALAACGDGASQATPERRGAPPPPPAATSAAGAAPACQRASIDDQVSKAFFPGRSEGLCLEGGAAGATFGVDAQRPLEGICDLFDGECQVYMDHGVQRVVEVRYVTTSAPAATVDVVISRFTSPDHAYAMFTKRTVGDGDPAVPSSKPMAGGAAAALGVGNAYLVRGAHLVEITYADDTADEPALRAGGERLIPPLASAIAKALPGDDQAPASVALLPATDRLPLGIRYLTADALGVTGAGPLALGYHQAGKVRYRTLAAAHPDAAAATRAFELLAKQPGAKKVDGVGEAAVRFERKEGELAYRVVLARVGARLVGVSDEPRALRAGMKEEERAALSLGEADQLTRVREAAQ